MAKKPQAELSKATKKSVKARGGMSKYRAHLGYLPSGYMANPKKFAKGLTGAQKTRIRRMARVKTGKGKTAPMNKRMFKEIYGFDR